MPQKKHQPTIEELEMQLHKLQVSYNEKSSASHLKANARPQLAVNSDVEYHNLTKYPITDEEIEEHRRACLEWDTAKVRFAYLEPGKLEDFVPIQRTVKRMLEYLNGRGRNDNNA